MSAHAVNFLNHSLSIGWLPPLAVLAASLVGSPHCVAMCGGILIQCVRTPAGMRAYHLGRLVGYSALGALAGALGATLLPLRTAGWISAFLLAVVFSWAAVRIVRGHPGISFIPPRILRWAETPFRNALPRAPEDVPSSFTVGLLTAFLPCGWLHTFVLAAVATGSAIAGASMLFAFWLGTLPALTASSSILRKLGSILQRKHPYTAALLLALAAFGSLWIKVGPLVSYSPEAGIHLSCGHLK